ncbi:MAG: glycoside hydrolase family 3 protein [Pseudomonadota bacterium]
MSSATRACILSVSGPVLTEAETALFAELQPWGVILMGRSCVTRDQVRALVDDIWTALGHAALVFIDQEGGRVARLKAPEWPLFPSGATYGALFERSPERGIEAAWLGHRLIARELSSMGIHADCAPVLDLPVEGAHDIIGDRAFGSSVEAISALGRAALRGLRDGGVAGVIKHMPGHGRALIDSHEDLPRVTAGNNELAADFAVFEALADAPMAMTAHIAFEAFDKERPATLSQPVISDIIRGRIGFDGLLMTDDLGMNALGGRLETRANGAIAAGCDIVLHCSGFVTDPDIIFQEMTEVGQAVPILRGKSLERARRAEAFATIAKPFDAEAGWKRMERLLANQEMAA